MHQPCKMQQGMASRVFWRATDHGANRFPAASCPQVSVGMNISRLQEQAEEVFQVGRHKSTAELKGIFRRRSETSAGRAASRRQAVSAASASPDVPVPDPCHDARHDSNAGKRHQHNGPHQVAAKVDKAGRQQGKIRGITCGRRLSG